MADLKMVDLTSFNKSLKTTWIRKYLDKSNHGKWKEFVELDLEKYGGNLIFRGNLNKFDSLKTISVWNICTRELLEIWPEVNFEEVVKTKEQFLEQPKWHNSLIRIENKPAFDKNLFSLGISKVMVCFPPEHELIAFLASPWFLTIDSLDNVSGSFVSVTVVSGFHPAIKESKAEKRSKLFWYTD